MSLNHGKEAAMPSDMLDTCLVHNISTRKAWLKRRRQGIGASDAAAVLGSNPWSDPLSLYLEKISDIEPQDAVTEAMEWGTRLEAVIAKTYQEKSGRKVEPKGRGFILCQNKDYPFMLATPDRIQHIGEPSLLEIKTLNAFQKDDWKEEPPLHYQIQLQHQLYVTGLRKGTLCCLIGGQKLVWFDMEAREDFHDVLVAKEVRFWDMVVNRVPPPADGSPSSAKAIERLYPKSNGKIMDLGWDAREIDIKIIEINAQKKRLDDELSKFKAEIKTMLGENEIGLLPGGGKWVWQTIERKGYEVESSTFRQLRRKK